MKHPAGASRYTEQNGFFFRDSPCYGPVPEMRVQAAEAALEARFPPSYRDFLLEIGAIHDIAGLPGPLPEGVTRPWSELVDASYWDDVVEFTRTMRTDLHGVEHDRHLIYIAPTGGDAWYCLDLSQVDDSGEVPVVLFGPDYDPPEQTDPNFLEFLRASYGSKPNDFR